MSKPVSYKRHRFPPEIIAHAVWLYFRFPLSLRLVEEMLLERGIVVSYETVRRWALKFGPAYARRLRRKTPSRRDIWHLDEVVVTIAGQKHWLWRAVRSIPGRPDQGRPSQVKRGVLRVLMIFTKDLQRRDLRAGRSW
jgi:putative transposase